MNEIFSTDRIIRKPECSHIVALSDVQIWRLEKQGRFPRRIQLGANSVGWRLSEVMHWIEQRAAATRPTEPEKLRKARQ